MRDVFGDDHGSYGRAAGTPTFVHRGKKLLTDFSLSPLPGSAKSSDAPQHVRTIRDLDVVVRLNGPHVGGVCFA
jgi:hypothetical protein